MQKKLLAPFLALIISFLAINALAQDRVMMQGFYWDVTPGGVWYDEIARQADLLGLAGFDGIWLPPPSKGAAGAFDVGYTPYDYYDLGDFDSAPGDNTSGTGAFVPTRYGDRAQLENALERLRANGIEIYMDIVLNHRSGGNLEPNRFAEWYTNRGGGSLFSPDGEQTFTAFPLTHGSGRIAWPVGEGNDFFFPNAVRNPGNTGDFFADNQIAGFHQMYVNSFGYQNALHDGDGSNLPIGDSLMVWGDWLTQELGLDGFRFDFVKGIHPAYLNRWVDYGAMRGKFHVHELFDGDMGRKLSYLNMVSSTQKPGAMFDFNMRFAYKEMSDGGNNYDIRNWHGRGLFNQPGVPYERIVTFVDNHDFDRTNYRGEVTQEGHSPVIGRKMLAYAHMLTHPGYAQVWWQDYFRYGLADEINKLVSIRKNFASGSFRILTRDGNPDSWSGPGDAARHLYIAERGGINDQTGLIVAINNHSDNEYGVFVDTQWPGRQLYDVTGNRQDTVQVANDGRAFISANPESYSVYVPVEFVLDIPDVNIAVKSIQEPAGVYFLNQDIAPVVELRNDALFSQSGITLSIEVSQGSEIIHEDELTVNNLAAGAVTPVSFPAFTVTATGDYRIDVSLDFDLDVDPSDNQLAQLFSVIDPSGDNTIFVNGIMNEPQYRLMAEKQNNRLGFGPDQNVTGMYFFDTTDTLYIALEGTFPLSGQDGIGLMLDFTERNGTSAGTSLGGIDVPGFMGAAESDFTMDFDVDLGINLLGANGRAILVATDYTLDTPRGVQIRSANQSPLGNGQAVSGPINSDIFPDNFLRYAYRSGGGDRQGLEIAISKADLGVHGGEVRGFAFIVSNTAYFSNVMVPGNGGGGVVSGDEGQTGTGNIGFNADFANAAGGGPYHSNFLELENAAPPLSAPVLLLPANNAENVATSLDFEWEQVVEADQYRIVVAENGQFSSPNAIVADIVTSETSVSISDFAESTNYGWRVRSEVTDNNVVSAWSETFFFTTIVGIADAPVNQEPADESINIPTTVALKWNTVAGAVTYDVQLADNQNFDDPIVDNFTPNTSFTVTGLDVFTEYFWRVRAVNPGGESDWSTTTSFSTSGLQTPTLSTPADSTENLTGLIAFSWEEAISAESYQVQISRNSNFELRIDSTLTGTTLELEDLQKNARYYWRVRSLNETDGASSWSGVFTFTTLPDLPAIPLLIGPADEATGLMTSVNLQWRRVSDAATYEVQLSTSSEFSDLTFESEDSSTMATVEGLDFLQKYYWRVRALNAAGAGDWSEVREFTTRMEKPARVSLSSPEDETVVTEENISLEWDTAASAEWYRVQVSKTADFTIRLDTTNIDATSFFYEFDEEATYFWRVRAENTDDQGDWSEVRSFTYQIPLSAEDEQGLPTEFALAQNYPNPFNPTTNIRFALPQDTHVRMEVFDITGRRVAILVNDVRSAGYHHVTFDGSNFASGLYLYRITAGSFVETRKLMLIK